MAPYQSARRKPGAAFNNSVSRKPATVSPWSATTTQGFPLSFGSTIVPESMKKSFGIVSMRLSKAVSQPGRQTMSSFR